MEKKDIDASISKFTEAAGLKPYNLRAYQNLGILYSRKKQYGEAEKILRKILELRPVSEEAHANLGNVYLLRGNLDEAEMWFKKALDINPDHEYSLQMIGEIERLRKSARRKNPSGG
jgi:tetratricopeptide (TPR) repeat protein